MSKHTPGPWIVKAAKGSFDFNISTLRKVVAREASLPDARLIAAAPVMYEILLDLCVRDDGTEAFREQISIRIQEVLCALEVD